jgi:hypothetical protein
VPPLDDVPDHLAVSGGDDEWLLYWTTRDAEIPTGRMALLDEWADIDARERALGIESGTPILIDPQSRVDPRLARFLTRSRFAFLADGSQRSYVTDYRLFFTFLWKRGRYWDEADHDDIDDYETYLATTRRAAIRQAQCAGRYDRLRGKQIVTKISEGRQRRVFWQDALGNKADAPINAIDAGERRRLFIEADGGLEPLQLWLTEGGMPMSYQSWEKVFSAGNDRCERFGKPIYLTPHACRHSFALKMLVTLDRALDQRFGLDRSERDHARKVYGDAFALVKDLLGHSSEETTRMIYLAPLNGLRLRSILDGNEGEDLDAILTRVAHSSRLVMDVNPTAEDV